MIRKMSKRDIVKNSIKEGHSDMDYDRIKQVYGLTPSEFRLYKTARNNLDTEKGYEAYYALMTAIRNRNGDDEVLYDLAASFAWDDKLAKAGDRYGYPYEDIDDIPIKESYSDIWSKNVWDAYDIALDYLGADGLCEALAKAMGTDELADNLKYIFQQWDIPFGDTSDEEFDESFIKEVRIGKTKEVKVLQGNWGYGWDDLVEYDKNDDGECRADLKAYKENDPSARYRVIFRRVPNPDYKVDESIVKESSDKKWLNVEVTEDEYRKLKKFLVDHNIKHEASGAYNMIHVEVYVDEYERQKVNDFLDTLDEGCHSGKRKSVRKGTKRK
jgi:hypothetical protein